MRKILILLLLFTSVSAAYGICNYPYNPNNSCPVVISPGVSPTWHFLDLAESHLERKTDDAWPADEYPFLYFWDFWGGDDFEQVYADNHYQCRNACRGTEGCNVFTYHYLTGTCYLKRWAADVIAWVPPNQVHNGYFFQGTNIFVSGVPWDIRWD